MSQKKLIVAIFVKDEIAYTSNTLTVPVNKDLSVKELCVKYFENGVDGFELAEKMQAGAERFGAKTELAEVYSVKLEGKIKEIDTREGVFYGKRTAAGRPRCELLCSLRWYVLQRENSSGSWRR